MSSETRPRVNRRHLGIVLCALLGAGVTPGIGALASDAGGSDGGWYTPDQAAHGHITFNSYCAECHRPDLTGAMGPALVGDTFLSQWINKPLGDLFQFEHSKMPASNPGSVPDNKMWDITAYILQKNGFSAGSTPLDGQKIGKTLTKSQH